MHDATGMNLNKISLLHYNGATAQFETHTTLQAAGQTISLSGLPTVTVFEDFVQLGCVRVSHECIHALAGFSKARWPGRITYVQPGNYQTDDPNSQPKKG
jgi:hypothetical protein